MKQAIINIIVLVSIMILFYKLSNYEQRMKQYNAQVCGVYGYESDCKTQLNKMIREDYKNSYR